MTKAADELAPSPAHTRIPFELHHTCALCIPAILYLADKWKRRGPQGTRWAEMKCILLLSQGHAQAKLAIDAFVFAASV